MLLVQHLKLLVLVFDLLGERRILRNKGRAVLLLFVLCYGVTLALNPEVIGVSALSEFFYLFTALAVLYSYGEGSRTVNMICNNLVCWAVAALNIVNIGMFYRKTLIFMPSLGRYIGMDVIENRLIGLFSGSPALSAVSLAAIGMGALLIAQNRERKWKYIYILPMLINYVAMLLANARAANYAFVFACAVFVFLMFVKYRKNVKGILLSSCVSLAMIFVAVGVCRAAQYGLSYTEQWYIWYDTYGKYTEKTTATATEVLDATETAPGDTVTAETETVTAVIESTTAAPAPETSTEITETVGSESDTLIGDSETSVSESDSETTVSESDSETSVSESESETSVSETPGSESESVTVTVETETSAVEPETETTAAPVTTTSPPETTTVPDFEFSDSTIDRHSSTQLSGRGKIWRMAIPAILKKPLWGYGMNRQNAALSAAGGEELTISGGLHNVYLDVLMAFGLAGLCCLALFLLQILIHVIRFFRYHDGSRWSEAAVLTAMIGGFLLYAMAESTPMMSMNHTAVTFWCFMTQLVALVEWGNRLTGHDSPDLLHVAELRITHAIKRVSAKKRSDTADREEKTQ